VLVGDGERRQSLEERMSQLGVAHRVTITGWSDAEGVRSALREARALVAPSFAEGLPVVIMEALAMGRPVISTHIAGIPELVRPGESGWLVPASSVTDLADALAEALDADPDRLGAMGQVGREAVLARHDARRNARGLLDAIREVRAR
jgi:glycosyltransferase involved in cell wall biosynthesis